MTAIRIEMMKGFSYGTIGWTYRTHAWAALRAVALLAIITLAACGSSERPAPESRDRVPQNGGGTYVYTCPDGLRFSARFQGDTAFVTLPDRELRLPQVISASGARYAAGGYLFWIKGDEALFETPAGSHEGCEAQRVDSPWEVSRLLGFDFRGIGQEPGWLIEIDNGRLIHLLLDYGERRINLPAPEPVRDQSGALVYEIRTEAHSARVSIEERPCRDIMSGEEFTHTVTVTIDGSEYRGCGRNLSSTPLIGTHWKLLEVGGRGAVASAEDQGSPFIRLEREEERVVGNTGCNVLGGSYEVDGDRLEFGELLTTLRACVDPEVSRQEQDFTHALEESDRYAIRADTLILYDDGEQLARFVAWYQR